MAFPWSAQQPIIAPRRYPDDASQEMALFGSSYPEVRIAKIRYEAIEEILETELETMLGSMDPEAVGAVLEIAGKAVFSEEPLDKDTPEDIAALIYNLRLATKYSLALTFLGKKKKSMLRSGRLIGDTEASVRMGLEGPGADLWATSSLRNPGEKVIRND